MTVHIRLDLGRMPYVHEWILRKAAGQVRHREPRLVRMHQVSYRGVFPGLGNSPRVESFMTILTARKLGTGRHSLRLSSATAYPCPATKARQLVESASVRDRLPFLDKSNRR
jgi:hypothetical protein